MKIKSEGNPEPLHCALNALEYISFWGGRGGHDLKSMRTKHVRKNWKVNDKVQNVCDELSLRKELDVHFAFQLIEFCFNPGALCPPPLTLWSL